MVCNGNFLEQALLLYIHTSIKYECTINWNFLIYGFVSLIQDIIKLLILLATTCSIMYYLRNNCLEAEYLSELRYTMEDTIVQENKWYICTTNYYSIFSIFARFSKEFFLEQTLLLYIHTSIKFECTIIWNFLIYGFVSLIQDITKLLIPLATTCSILYYLMNKCLEEEYLWLYMPFKGWMELIIIINK
jgi:hypothetical protein